MRTMPRRSPGMLIVAVIITLGMLGAPIGSSAQSPVQGGTLTVALGTDALTLDPHNYKAANDLVVDALIYDNLVEFDLNLRLHPALAASWLELTPTSWRFDLRKGVKFSDGTPFNAEAVKLNLERAAKAPRAAGYVGVIDRVDVVNDYRVIVHLKSPSAPFMRHLATFVPAIISPAALEKYGPEITSHPVGTGPFMLAEWIPNQRIRLVRNPDYWGRRPYLDAVVFRPIPESSTRFLAFRGGEVNVISDPPTNLVKQIQANPSLTVQVSPATRDVRVGFTVTNPPLDNPKVRQALAMAIDRGPLVKFVLNGLGREAQCGMIPPEIMKKSPCSDLPYDTAKAKQLLAEAGFPNGLSLQFWTPEGRYLGDRQIAEAVQQQLQQINVRTQVKVLEWGAYLDALARHEAQAFIIGWGFATGDPAQAMSQNFQSKSAFNFANYQSADFDRMLIAAEGLDDPVRRQKMYSEMEQTLLVRDAVAKEIYYKLNIYGLQKRVHNFGASPLELIDLSQTWMSPQ